MDLRTTDALKAAANAWPGGRGLVVVHNGQMLTDAEVHVNHDGSVVLHLHTAESLKTAKALTEMNTDPTTGSTEHPVDESIPALVEVEVTSDWSVKERNPSASATIEDLTAE